VRVYFVVPSIRSREVAPAQRSGVQHCEHMLKPLDFGNGLFGVHASQSSSTKRDPITFKKSLPGSPYAEECQ
jgi:hypothetical protein